jgi:hypothetical protein
MHWKELYLMQMRESDVLITSIVTPKLLNPPANYSVITPKLLNPPANVLGVIWCYTVQ